MPRFELFGPSHLLALLTLAGLAALAVALARRPRFEVLVRAATAAALILLIVLHFADLVDRRPLRLGDVLPLHLCDMAIVLALIALATRHRATTEVLFFWTMTGTLLACVTPALGVGFPSVRFVTYFGLHGGVIVAAAILVFGLGLRPRPGSVLRVWLYTNLYAAVVLAVDLGLGANFLYLLRKPRGPTLLDLFGPWPVYLGVVEVIAALSFMAVAALAAPRGEWGRGELRPTRAATSAR